MRRWIAAGAIAAAAACTPAMGGARGGPGGGPGGPGGPGPGMVGDALRPQYLNSGTLAALPGFTSVVRAGNVVYASGQVALNDQGAVVGPGDLAAQARQAFANLAHVLHIAGAVPDEVLRLNIYVVNLKAGDWDVIRREGAPFFPERNPPAGNLVGVQSLPRDSLLIAVDAQAVIRAMFRPRR